MSTWPEVAAAAKALPHEARRARLATVLLVGDPFASSSENVAIGLPLGKPRPALGREVATGLLAEGVDGTLRVLALMQLHRGVLRSSVDETVVLRAYHEAVAVAAAGADRVVEAWARAACASATRRFRHVPESLVEAEKAVEVADAAPPSTAFYAIADAPWSEAQDPTTVTTATRVYALRTLAAAHRFSGHLDPWERTLRLIERTAAPLYPRRYSLYGLTLNAIAVLERRLEGRTTTATLDLYRQHAADPDDPAPARGARSMRSALLHQEAYDLAARGDKQGSILRQQDRIAYDVRTLAPEWAGLTVPELTAAVRTLPEEVRRFNWNGVGNSAHEIDGLELVLGDATDRAARVARALEFSELAEAIWAGWGHNGLRAIRLHRARIAAVDDPGAVAEMLDVAETAPAPALRVAAVLEAAVVGGPLSTRTLAMVERMMTEGQQRRDTARLHLARAWLRRPGGPLPDPASIDDARAAAERLDDDSPQEWQYLTRTGWVLGLWSAELDDPEVGREPLRRALKVYGRLLQSATTRSYSKHVVDLWAPMLRIAMDHAERWQDLELADLVGEISRRLTVPQQLEEAGSAPDAPEGHKQIALEAGASANAASDTAMDADDSDVTQTPVQADEPDEEAHSRGRAAAKERGRRRQQDVYYRLEDRYGPLGRLADFDNALERRAADLVRSATRPTFVLQLLPSTYRTLLTDDEPRLYRRLTWSDGDGLHERLDSVPLDPNLLREQPSHERHFDARADLFPEPLRDAFLHASRGEPIRLHIVPTGLYHLYWDGLQIGGIPLIGRAITSQHTSTTAAGYLADLPDRRGLGSVGLFDPALTFAAFERHALEQEFPDLDQPAGTADLAVSPIDQAAVFAMALHGDDDEEGWLQVKHLPNGIDTLSAAEALNYTFPRTCVLASCFSTIRSSDGFDLSGFPVALFSSGATTVVGSVNKIDDEATSEILSLFYRRLREIGDPVAALRDARLEWIGTDRERYSNRHLWARLVAYGGASF